MTTENHSNLQSDSRSPLLSIIIVSFNTRDMTCACIQSVFDQALDRDFEIIVVDNASTDGSAEAIAEQFPQVKLIASPQNIGFARGNNLAVQQARGTYVLLLNTDTVILDHAVDKLVDFAKSNPAAKLWGGRTLWGDGTLNPTSCWRFMTLWSLFAQAVGLTSVFRNNEFFNREGYGDWQRDTVRQVELVTGCFLLIEKKFWDDLEGFDDDFFMYGEEADLCRRAAHAGAAPMITPQATIVHYGGASQSAGANKVMQLLTGKSRYIRKHFGPAKSQVALLLLKLHVGLRAFASWFLQRVRNTPGRKQSADEWAKVWANRGEWTNP